MPKLTLIIGNKNYSSWSLRPWVFMQENQIDFNEQKVPLSTSTTYEQLKPHNSDFKVPVLLDGDITVWDSLAILEYVSEHYLDSKGWPEDKKARAMARSVSAEMHSSFFNIRNKLPMNCKRHNHKVLISKETKQEILRVEALWEQCLSSYGGESGWLFGEYSIADAMFAPMVLRFQSYAIDLGQTAKNYSEKMLKQKSIKQWIEDGINETEVIIEAEI